MYHIVCPAKYRRMVFSELVDAKLKEVCTEIEKRYEITFLEIGTDSDHVHFLVQSVPTYSPKQIVQIIKSLTAREIFNLAGSKKHLWGGKFWTDVISSAPSGGTARKKRNDKELWCSNKANWK